jgi:hypothetical protein
MSSSIRDSREVYDFIWRLNNGFIRIGPEINNIFDKSNESLGTRLANALRKFEHSKAESLVVLDSAIVVPCRATIAEAYAHGVIIDTGFEKLQDELNQKVAEIAKLREQNKKSDADTTTITEVDAKDGEIAELKETLQKVSTDLVYWRGRHDELDIRLKEMFKYKQGDDVAGA